MRNDEMLHCDTWQARHGSEGFRWVLRMLSIQLAVSSIFGKVKFGCNYRIAQDALFLQRMKKDESRRKKNKVPYVIITCTSMSKWGKAHST